MDYGERSVIQYLEVFGAAFIYVMLRAFQQRNVAFDNYGWVIPTSYGMAIVDTFIIASISKAGWSLEFVVSYGTAGALGSICAMLFHKRYVNVRKTR